jgi:hypothetical protein
MARTAYLDLESLKTEAQEIAQCSDWGDDDFWAPLRVFITSLNAEAELTAEGVLRTKSHILKMLVGRLRLHRDRKLYPEIEREQVKAPIFVTGQSRSGTSHLYGLLAADQRNHAPLHWQIWTLSPPPNHPSTDREPQIALAERYIRFEGWQDPDLRSKHDYSATGPAEDTLIQDYTFASKTFSFFWNTPSYAARLAEWDLADAYRFEHKVLQAMQFGQPRERWVLKSPIHLSQFPYLFGEFPDARIVITHRDPVKCLGSVMSLLGAHRKQYGNAAVVVERAYALAVMEDVAATMDDLIRRRREPAFDARFADVGYLDLERDALSQVARIYDRFGIAFPPEAQAAVVRHLAENRKGKFGLHRYELEEFGLRTDEVRERFRFYTDHFGVECEAP